jgi:hypothetical protein
MSAERSATILAPVPTNLHITSLEEKPRKMPLAPPLDLLHWLRDNGERLKPPVNSFCLHSGTDFFVMVVGGPNARADYHVNETEVLECPESS